MNTTYRNSCAGKNWPVLAVCLVLLFSINDAWSRTLLLVADPWCPYNCTAGSQREGYMIDIARAAFAYEGYTVEYREMPWNRALLEVEEGRHDGAVGAFIEDAPHLIFPKTNLGYSSQSFLTRQDSDWKFKGLESLEKTHLGYIQGYSYGKEMDDYLETTSPERVTALHGVKALEQAFGMLVAGRVDAIIDDTYVLLTQMEKMKLQPLVRFAGVASVANPVYIAFSIDENGGQELADAFDRGMKKLRDENGVAPILAKYGLADWQ